MKLKIEAFRGVNRPLELAINHHRDLTILYGENGSGKTTISDALEFVFFGTSGSLEEKSLDGKNKLPALVHAKRQPKDLVVTWEEGTLKRVAKLQGVKAVLSVVEIPTQLRTLRRNLITKLIEETPSLRFQRIRDFVEFRSLEREENQLGEFVKTHKGQQDFQQGIVSSRLEELRSLHAEFFLGVSKPPSVKDWASGIIGQSDETVLESIRMLKDLEQQIIRLRDDWKPLSDSYIALADSKKTVGNEEDALKHLAAKQSGQLAGAIDLLEEAGKFLASQGVEACPICDTPKSSADLLTAVTSKLFTLKEISSQNAKFTAAKRDCAGKKSAQETQQTNFFNIITLLVAVHGAAVENESWKVPPLIQSLLNLKSAENLTEEWFHILKTEAAQLKPLSEYVEHELGALLKSQSLKQRLVKLLAERKAAEVEFVALAQLIDKADKIREIFRSERTRQADAALAAVSEDFARLYKSVHPGEEIEQIRLYLHPDRKGSAMLTGDLHGKVEASPVAYLSESHLDTLGLCLFLALEKKLNPKETFLFLDDAIASVDEAHMAHLYETILAEAKHFKHVLITSHYQPLRFKFKWGQLTTQNVDFLELRRWTIDGGISFQRGCESEILLLRKRLAEQDDPNGIAGKAGVVLEYLFDFLTGIYRCRMPRIPGAEQRWSLGDYKSGLESDKKKLLLALKAEHVDETGAVTSEIPLAPILENLFTQLELRNCLGAHYKELAGQFNDLAEATKLGQSTCALLDALCDSDNQLPESNANGSFWTNRGSKKSRRLHPLQSPK
jgi:DNA repair exonuclease SbcCD ATPase subunit